MLSWINIRSQFILLVYRMQSFVLGVCFLVKLSISFLCHSQLRRIRSALATGISAAVVGVCHVRGVTALRNVQCDQNRNSFKNRPRDADGPGTRGAAVFSFNPHPGAACSCDWPPGRLGRVCSALHVSDHLRRRPGFSSTAPPSDGVHLGRPPVHRVWLSQCIWDDRLPIESGWAGRGQRPAGMSQNLNRVPASARFKLALAGLDSDSDSGLDRDPEGQG